MSVRLTEFVDSRETQVERGEGGEPKLSIRSLKEDEERRAHREYRAKLKAESSFGTLGDLLAKKFNLDSK